MPQTSVSVIVLAPGIGLLIAAWAVAAILYGLGVLRRRPVWIGIGLVFAGILAFVTVAVIELATLPAGARGYDVSIGDLLVIGLSGFLGGALAMLGGSYITIGSGRIPPRP